MHRTRKTVKFLVLIGIFSVLIPIASSKDIVRRTLNEGNLILEGVPTIAPALRHALERYKHIRYSTMKDWSRDGKHIYISTRFSNVNQLHKVVQPMGARQQLTFFKEPIGAVSQNPVNALIAFTMDKGGSENAQIYTLDPKGETQLLTDGKSRNSDMLWSNKGKYLAFQSTRRDGKSNDIWLMENQNKNTAKILLAANDGSDWAPIAWSKDDANLLVQQYISANHSLIYLLNVKTGHKQLLQGDINKPSTNYALDFTYNDGRYFFITDQFDDFNKLAIADIHHTHKTQIITDDINWDVDSFAINKDDSQAAFSINENGLSALYLLDTKKLNFTPVTHIPKGLIGTLGFNPVYNQLAMTINTAQSSSDVFVLELGKQPLEYSDIAQWTKSEVGGLDTSQFVEPELFSYKSFDALSISAFIYRQKSANTQPKPVIIDIHGGPESQFRPSFNATYQLWIKSFNAAIIAPNVRGSSGYGKKFLDLDNGYLREDSVRDIGALLDWIETQPDLDKNRVVVVGGSYGGYMVLASAAHYSHRLKAGIDIVGISNFVTFLENTQDYRKDLRRVEYGDERDTQMREFLDAISPNRHVDKITIPLLIVQGQNDPRVPVTESEQMVSALRSQDKSVWYMNAMDEGHGYRKKENRDILLETMTLFLQTFL